MKMTTNGQVTIPPTVRDFLQIGPNDEVFFTVEGDRVVFDKKQVGRKDNRFKKLLGSRMTGHTTEQLMREIRPYAFSNDDPGLEDSQ